MARTTSRQPGEQRRRRRGGRDGHGEIEEPLAAASVEAVRGGRRSRPRAAVGGGLEGRPQPLRHDVAVELAFRQATRVGAHAGRRRGLVGERPEGGGQGGTVAGRHVQARPVGLDEAPQPAVEVDDGGLAGSQRVEELVGRVGFEGGVGRKERQGGVGGAHDGGQTMLGHRGQEAHVAQAELAHPRLEPRPLAAVADGDQGDVVAARVGERGGRVDELVEAVGASHGAGVEAEELAFETVLAAEAVVDVAGAKEVEVAGVGHEDQLLGGYAAGAQGVARALAQDDDLLGAIVDQAFEPLRRGDQEGVAQRAQSDGGGGPQIADLEHEGRLLETLGDHAGYGDRERR